VEWNRATVPSFTQNPMVELEWAIVEIQNCMFCRVEWDRRVKEKIQRIISNPEPTNLDHSPLVLFVVVRVIVVVVACCTLP
jgi:hypothetical protein